MYLYKADCVWQNKERCDRTNTDGSTVCGRLDQREFGDQVVGHNCNGIYRAENIIIFTLYSSSNT